MEYYALIKHIHMGAASLSFFGFLLRGFWMLKESPLLQAKLSRILPHIVDTLLLGAAIYLLILLKINPIEVNWLSAKIILLVAYIVCGTIALKRGETKMIRVIFLMISLAIILAIFAIAAIKPWQ